LKHRCDREGLGWYEYRNRIPVDALQMSGGKCGNKGFLFNDKFHFGSGVRCCGVVWLLIVVDNGRIVVARSKSEC